MVSACDPSLSNLEEWERVFFYTAGTGPQVHIPFSCVHHAFEAQASAQPDAIAVKHQSEFITFGELDCQANNLASRLVEVGIKPGKTVCLVVQRSIPMVIGILAILKAGGQYVPLDGGVVPDKSLRHIVNDTQCSAFLVLQKFAYRTQSHSSPTLILEDAIAEDLGKPGIKPYDSTGPSDGVYVIYTSGTTGKPKGVDVRHSNVTNLICCDLQRIGMQPGSKVAQILAVSFDMAAWEILGSLANGCTLVIRTNDWKATLKEVNVVIATPTILNQYRAEDFPNIKFISTAGEPCSQKIADDWAETVSFNNCCGPTETTIINTLHAHVKGKPLSIGKPTPNNSVYILDDDLNAVSIGKTGTVWAGGAGITAGYLNLPELTSEKWKDDKFTNNGQKMFNTGDLGRWTADGNIEFLGRIDDQVKIKGFRVELDGISAAMESCAKVSRAKAIFINEELWGFFSPPTVPVDTVRKAIALVQPYYAVPKYLVPLDGFPLTVNGKADKKELVSHASSLKDIPRDNSLDMIQLAKDPSQLEIPMKHENSQNQAVVVNVSSASSPSPSEKSEGGSWKHLDQQLPEKQAVRSWRNSRHIIFILYRRLFSIILLVNLAILIDFAINGTNAPKIGTACAANLTVAILLRQDHVINILYTVMCSAPTSWPLSIRRNLAKVYHLGGIHSGSATAAVIWLCFMAVEITINFSKKSEKYVSIETLIITWLLLTLLSAMVIFAYPTFRTQQHDLFERIHRFGGWTALFLVWLQTIFLTNDHKKETVSLGSALKDTPGFWLLLIISLSIVYPWLHLRKVSVRAEALSGHAVRLHFDYCTPVSGAFTRISKSPLFEWHSFAVIPVPGKKGYSLVVSKAGDWTNEIILNPPSSIWVRGVPTCGVMRIAPLFKKVVMIGTGSGIGPCLAQLLKTDVQCRVLWTTPKPRETFGNEIVDGVLNADPQAVIYDTRAHGKPDMVKLAYGLYVESGAEAVIIISNKKLTKKVVYGMESRGIPAFGAIWDS